jgi:hypothetical protein
MPKPRSAARLSRFGLPVDWNLTELGIRRKVAASQRGKSDAEVTELDGMAFPFFRATKLTEPSTAGFTETTHR